MSDSIVSVVQIFAQRAGAELPPNWSKSPELEELDRRHDSSLDQFCARLNLSTPEKIEGRPGPHQLPLLTYHPKLGWAVAEQWESLEAIRATTPDGAEHRRVDGDTTFYELELPRMRHRDDAPSALSVFTRALRKRKKVFVSAIIATVIVNMLTLATSLYSMQIYDRVIPTSGFSTLWVLTVGVLFSLLVEFTLRTTRALMIEREAAKVDAEVSEFFFARAQAIRLDARPPSVGTMAAQIRGWEQIRSLLSSASIFLIADLPFAIFFILVIASIGGPIAYVPMVALPIALGLALVISRLIRKDTAKAQLSGNRKNGLLVEGLDAAETVKANRGEWHMLGRWNSLMEELQLHEDPVKRWSSLASSIFQTLQQISYVLLIAFGATLVAGGELTAGALIACAIIAGRVNGPLVSQLPNFLIQWGYARSSLQALDSIMSLPLDQAPEVEGLRPEKLEPSLQLLDVKFSYPGARSEITIPMLRIGAGERVAVLGGIGSGKSTMLRMMAGLYAPKQGSVTVGGLDVQQIAPDVLRRTIGYLAQDTRLLNGTLRDNVMMGLPVPSDDEILEQAELVGIKDFIAGHPKGLDLPIAEGGRGLSGGQRTLANLVRLFLARPPMWLLDEPTANLDQTTEAKVIAAIRAALTPDMTLVLVTHRLQLLPLVDRVIVLVNGRVALDGPTADVMAKLKRPAKPPQPLQAMPAA
ncbi:MAG TPA: ATP-binding cassette domain-containing protein [Sphingomicrobium sp.]|nr:ATP-binding cassette domain-containing protein [Sphingomicrobium sp.]